MTLHIKARYLWIATALLAVIAVFGFAAYAHANPFYTSSKAQTGTATTTQTYLRSGLATSTTVYDSYEQLGTNQTNQGNITIPDTVVFAIDGIASTTSSIVSATCEYSDNYNGTNGDWYQNQLFGGTFAVSTTTNPIGILTPISYAFSYSTTSINGVIPTAGPQRFQKMISCPVPTRFVRLVVTNSVSPVSIWVQAIPKKQRNSGN